MILLLKKFKYFCCFRKAINKGIGVDNLHYLNDGLWKVWLIYAFLLVCITIKIQVYVVLIFLFFDVVPGINTLTFTFLFLLLIWMITLWLFWTLKTNSTQCFIIYFLLISNILSFLLYYIVDGETWLKMLRKLQCFDWWIPVFLDLDPDLRNRMWTCGFVLLYHVNSEEMNFVA